MITHRKWSEHAEGRCEYGARPLAEFVWGKTPNTARGREFLRLYDQCAEKRAKADDPRVAQLLAWIAEERVALAEEEGLEARARALDVEQPEETGWPELRPLGKAWQEAERRLWQMERQIDAKIRLLLRLEKRAQDESSKPGGPSEYNELSKLGEHTTPYKPDEIIARTSEAEVRGLSSGTWAQAADLKYAGPRYPLLPATEDAVVAAASGRRFSLIKTGGQRPPLQPRPAASAQNRGTNPRRPLESMPEAFGPTRETVWESAWPVWASLPGAENRAAEGLRASL
ncbi:MAG TPA: hypothetical protein VGX94_13155, partial [Terriglobia bacterium]|nr:hypothetical protein [Terriglobia bacterium]